MTALAQNLDLYAAPMGSVRQVPLEASADPYQGSLMSYESDGYVHELVAGEPFAGVCNQQVESADAPSSDGDIRVELTTGLFVIRKALTVTQTNVDSRSEVWATDDNTITLTPTATATKIGVVIGKDGSNAVILCATEDVKGALGDSEATAVVTNDTGNLTLTNYHLGKIITCSNTAALTLTLPAAANCTGKRITYTKLTSATGAITIDGNGSETIDGSATNADVDAKYDLQTVISDGSEWVIAESKLA